MKTSLLTILVLFMTQSMAWADSTNRILCYEPYEDEILEMTGVNSGYKDDVTCRSMMSLGAVGMCFQGDAQTIVDQMNEGLFEYPLGHRVLAESAQLFSDNIITYSSYEDSFAPWTRDDVEMFRCPPFEDIKTATTQLADKLNSSVDSAVSRVYREEFGLPPWLQN